MRQRKNDLWHYRGHRLKQLEWGLWKVLDEPRRYFFCYRPHGARGTVVRRWVFTGAGITLQDLRQHVRDVRARAQASRVGIPLRVSADESLNEYLAELRRRNRTEKHIDGVGRSCRLFLERMGVQTMGQVDVIALERFLRGLQADRDLSPRSLNKYRVHLSGWFGWARRHRHLEENPAELVPRAREERRHAAFPRPAEMLRIVRTTPDRWERAWWTLLALTGLRRGSFVALERSSFRPEGIEVKATKRRREWFLRFDAGCPLWGRDLSDLGRRLWRIHPPTVDLLRGGWKEVRRRTGYRFTLHSLRHAFCSWLFLMGEHPSDVAAWAHHSSAQTTEAWYAHLRPRGRDQVETNRALVGKLRGRLMELSGGGGGG